MCFDLDLRMSAAKYVKITPAFHFQERCSMSAARSALLVASQCTEYVFLFD